MKKLLLTNVVYGPAYADLFLNQHLKSFLDDTNIPAFKDRLEYHVFTDEETLPFIQKHKNFLELDKNVPVHIWVLSFPKGVNRFDQRYGVLIQTFKMSVEKALALGSYCSAMVADLVCAKDYLKLMFEKLDAGYDSVFMLPLRSAAEAMIPKLNAAGTGALPALELGQMGYENLHPLWVACHVDTSQFTKMPFTLLWNSGTGLVAKSYSITPIVFDPTEAMTKVTQVIDVEIPGMCKNPFWATDWTDAPILGVEPLVCYYPPFANHKFSAAKVKDWAERALNVTQLPFVQTSLYYPNKEAYLKAGDIAQDINNNADGVVSLLKA